MSGELERRAAQLPLTFQETNDFSRLENFLVPSRELTRDEQAVYNKAKYNFAQLNVASKMKACAIVQLARQQLHMQSVFSAVAVQSYQTIDQVTDPRAREIVERFTKVSLETTAAGMNGIHRTLADRMESIVGDSYPQAPEPVRQMGFWEIVFGSLGS